MFQGSAAYVRRVGALGVVAGLALAVGQVQGIDSIRTLPRIALVASADCIPNIPSPSSPPGVGNPADPCLSTGTDADRFSPLKAAQWAAAHYQNVTPSAWRNKDSKTENHCTEFVSAALHEGGLPYDRDWKPTSAQRAWDIRNERAYYIARSLRNYLVRKEYVDEIPTTAEQGRSGSLSEARAGDVFFYDWRNDVANYSAVHMAIVVDTHNGVPVVVDQGEGASSSMREWHRSGQEQYKDQLLAGLPQYEEARIYLLRWRPEGELPQAE